MARGSIVARRLLAMVPCMGWGLGWGLGCNTIEPDEAREVARATQQTMERGLDRASDAAERAATKTKETLGEVDVEQVRGAWDAAVSAFDRPSDGEGQAGAGEASPSAEGTADPLADVATAITCDEARERCTVTADFAERARLHSGRVARQVRLSPARGEVRGIRIDAIEAGTLAERVGLKTGDVVTHVNGVALGSPQDAMMLYMRVRAARQFEVHYRRGPEERSLQVDVV